LASRIVPITHSSRDDCCSRIAASSSRQTNCSLLILAVCEYGQRALLMPPQQHPDNRRWVPPATNQSKRRDVLHRADVEPAGRLLRSAKWWIGAKALEFLGKRLQMTFSLALSQDGGIQREHFGQDDSAVSKPPLKALDDPTQ